MEEQMLQPSEQLPLTKKERHRLEKLRRQEERDQKRQKNTIKKVASVAVIMFAVGGIIVGLWWLVTNAPQSQPLMGEKIPDQGAPHVARGQTHPPYNSNPPTSGWHWGDGVAGPGIKDQQVADELVLHSMEHGATVLWYKDDLNEDDVDRLKQTFRAASGKKIMIPRKDLDVPVALTSWNYLLKLETIDEEKIIKFIETNSDHAPENAPI